MPHPTRNRAALLLATITLILFTAACGSNTPTPIPAPTSAPFSIETAVAATLTAIAPTPGSGTPIPPQPTQIAAVTPTATPTLILPSPTPGGETNPPVVQLIAPTNGVQISANQIVNVVALITDDDGIARVQFYADNVLLSTQTPNNPTTYQATFLWRSAQVGTHVLFVIAYDQFNNASTPAPASVVVNADTNAPQVTILAPPSPQNVQLGAQLNVQVASSDDAGITQLQLLVDGQPYNQVNAPAGGQTPFSATFIYAANTVGTHTLVVRATDTAGNTADSNPLTVNVGDNTPPSVNVTYSRTNVRQNEQVTVYTNAADTSGIQRVELWADGGIYNVYNVPNPRQQTTLAIQQIWASNTPGNHQLFVRVFDVNSQSTNSPATNIFVRLPEQPTPTITPYIPPPTPFPTRTPPPVVPPPNCQIDTPGTNFREELPNPIHIRWNCTAQGGMALMQVFAQYSGTMATELNQVGGDGQQQQSGEFDWFPPSPGVVDVFVTASDRIGQRGESPHIPGVVERQRPPTVVPPPTFEPPPTREPERPNIDGRWVGPIDNGQFIINLEPRIGCSETQCAYGGSFEDTREGVHGELNGQYDGRTLTLSVEGAQPGDVTWNFEGQVTDNGNEIAGNWSEARAGVPSLQRGSVSFRR